MLPTVTLWRRMRPELTFAVASIVACAALTAGCGHDDGTGATNRLLGARPTPGALGAPQARYVYPLAIGDRWLYDVHQRSLLVTGGVAQVTGELDIPWLATITSTERLGSLLYFAVEQRDATRPGTGYTDLVHQDGSAYVVRSVSPILARLPSEPAAGTGPVAREAVHLRYPLYVGARWSMGGLFSGVAREVVDVERLRLAAGSFACWRVRETSAGLGPRESIEYWYAEPGLVRVRSHLEQELRDNSGNVIGTAVFDSDQQLREFHLVPPRPAFPVSPAGGR